MPFADYFEAVWGFPLEGSPAHGVDAPLTTLIEVARELLQPTRIARETLAETVACSSPASTACCRASAGSTPNDWGLGPELRDGKQPHWTGTRNSPRTFGHFGGGGASSGSTRRPGSRSPS